MKLRIANKILGAVGTPDQARYSDHQIGRARARYEKTASAKAANRFWLSMMRQLGTNGRAKLVARWSPGAAFDLLMREGEVPT